MTTTQAAPVMCGNPDEHGPAIATVRWLNGRYYDNTACASCLATITGDFIDDPGDRHPILIAPAGPLPSSYSVPRPQIVCLCGSTRFYDAFQQANYDCTMHGEIVLSVGFYPHAKAQHGHGEGVGHDSTEKTALDELHKRKIDLADRVLVVSDESGYFGDSTASEIGYAVRHGKPVDFAVPASMERARELGLLR